MLHVMMPVYICPSEIAATEILLLFQVVMDKTYTVEDSGNVYSIPVTHTLTGVDGSLTELVLDDSTPFPDFEILQPEQWAGFEAGDTLNSITVSVMLPGGGGCFGIGPASIPTVTGPPSPPKNVRWCPHCGGLDQYACVNPCVSTPTLGGFLVFNRPTASEQGQGAAGEGSLLELW